MPVHVASGQDAVALAHLTHGSLQFVVRREEVARAQLPTSDPVVAERAHAECDVAVLLVDEG